jgi:hypothetical protein
VRLIQVMFFVVLLMFHNFIKIMPNIIYCVQEEYMGCGEFKNVPSPGLVILLKSVE